jgi:hypothetical protein
MGSNREGNRLMRTRRAFGQSGMTLIGFLLLAVFVGILGLAVIKIVPLYLEKMRVGTVLGDLQTELGTGGNSAASIRTALQDRFYIENLEPLSSDELDISLQNQGFLVRVQRESRAPFFADLHFVVVIDEQVEVSR